MCGEILHSSHEVPASFKTELLRLFSLAAVHGKCSLYDTVKSKLTPRQTTSHNTEQ